MPMMELASIPREYPQFGRHLRSLLRPASEVLGQQSATKPRCGCSEGRSTKRCYRENSSCSCGGEMASCTCSRAPRDTPPSTQWEELHSSATRSRLTSPHSVRALAKRSRPQSLHNSHPYEPQKTCRELCPRQAAEVAQYCETPGHIDLLKCADASDRLERCCRRVCHQPGRRRKSKDQGSCNYGDSNICCTFLDALALIRHAELSLCKCCWKLNCVCCETGDTDDTPGIDCVRACLYCRTGGTAWGREGDTRVHEDCLRSCKDEGAWGPEDESAFLRAVEKCTKCNSRRCQIQMNLAVVFRDTSLADLADCDFSPVTGGAGDPADSAPGCDK